MHPVLRRLLLVASLAALDARPVAQGGGFLAHDLFLQSPVVQSLAPDGAALVRIDPTTGAAALQLELYGAPNAIGAACFDPYRQRILLCGRRGSVLDPQQAWLVDAAGNVRDLGFGGVSWHAMAPTGDGRIYFHDITGVGLPFRYLDGAGVLRTLMDPTGQQPWSENGVDVRCLAYDAGTNALFQASTYGSPCPGGNDNKVNVRRLPLSADGSRVVGPVACVQFEVSPSGEGPTGWSRGPGGQLVLIVDTNANALEPRMLLLDPATLAFSVFASNNNTWSAATTGGSWSSALDKCLIVDTSDNVLRAFSQGEADAGQVIVPTYPISELLGGGEFVTLFEIPFSDCEGAWLPYGTGLGGAGGFVPTLSGAGCPTPGGALEVKLGSAVGGAIGTLFVGLASAELPFKGGHFLVDAIVLPVGLLLGGAPGTAGAGSADLPAQLPNEPLLSGLSLFLQAGFADAGAPHGVSLTNGLELELR